MSASDEHHREAERTLLASPPDKRPSVLLLVLRFAGGLILLAAGVQLILAGSVQPDMGGLVILGGVGVVFVAYLLIATASVAVVTNHPRRGTRSAE